MFKLLKNYTKDGWWAALLGPIFVVGEVFLDVQIPLVMARIIDEGITARGGDIPFIIELGITMVGLAILAGLSGALSGLFASIASCRFVKNIRNAEFAKLQSFDFQNIEKFPVSSVVNRVGLPEPL